MYAIKDTATGKILETRSTAPYDEAKLKAGQECLKIANAVAGDTVKGDKLVKRVVAALKESQATKDFRDLDADSESEPNKTIIKFLQERFLK